MQIVFHIGAHCTGQDRLIRSLLKNRDTLAQSGIAVPGPGKYRRTINEAVGILRGAPASEEAEDVLLEAVLDTDDAERVVLSNDNFICTPSKVLEHGQLYPRIGKTAWLRNAFPAATTEFALSLRNMATFLPALYETLGGEAALTPEAFLNGADPRDLFWSDVVLGIREANPEAPILVWCDEDSPILWPEIMQEMCDLDPLVPLKGGNDLTRHLLSKEGNALLAERVAEAPPETEADRRRVVEEILAEFPDDAETYQEISLPGWSEELMDDLTEAYDEDVEEIGAIPGVTLLTP